MTDRSFFPDDIDIRHDGGGALPSGPLSQRERLYRRYERQRERHTQLGTRKTLTGLEWSAPYWFAEPGRLFRMQGLLVMKAPEGARLTELSVGNIRALPLGGAPLPLSTFTLLEELDGKSTGRCQARPHYPTCELGVVIRLRVTDAEGRDLAPPAFEATLWGIVPDYL